MHVADGASFFARHVVLTNGTFLNGLMHIGRVSLPGGRTAEPAAHGLTEQLREIGFRADRLSHGITEQLVELGFRADRMKTGTPVRVDGRTIDFSKAKVQGGECDFHHFSYLPEVRSNLKQRDCYIVYTNPETCEILRRGLPDSPLYNGQA